VSLFARKVISLTKLPRNVSLVTQLARPVSDQNQINALTVMSHVYYMKENV
jgi:hypothetical protein